MTNWKPKGKPLKVDESQDIDMADDFPESVIDAFLASVDKIIATGQTPKGK